MAIEKQVETAERIHNKMNQARALLKDIYVDLRELSVNFNEAQDYKEESLVWLSSLILESAQENLRQVERGLSYALEDD